MFNIRIVNLDSGSYLRMAAEKALAKAERENNDFYLQACLERRRTFTPMVYSADGIPGAEALPTQKRLAALLSYFRGETASGRSREARDRQIARAGKPQAQDVRATKQARPETKSKKTVKSNYG